MKPKSRSNQTAPVPPVVAEPVPTSVPVPTSDPVGIFFTEAEMLQLQVAQDSITIASMKIGMVQKDGEHDELQLKVQQERLQREQTEYALRSMKRFETIKHLSSVQGEALNKYNQLKADLEKKYGIPDLQKVAYDDVTGRVTVLPDPTQ